MTDWPRHEPDTDTGNTTSENIKSERSDYRIREYRDTDEASWLRCRVLSFLDSRYYDDVKIERTRFEGESIRLVAVHPKPVGVRTPGPDEVVGIIDVELPGDGRGDGAVATIDTIAVHPDHLRHAVASRLLAQALERLGGHGYEGLDAWTRDDEAANGWYLKSGFTEEFCYLHVYKSGDDPDAGWIAPDGLSAPVTAFAHGDIEDLAQWQDRYRRVVTCRRYLLRLPAPDDTDPAGP